MKEQAAGGKVVDEKREHAEIASRICELCQERKTLSPHVRFCPRCLGKKGARARMANLAHQASSREKPEEDPPAHEKTPKNRNVKVLVDFSRREDLLKRVTELADDEFRPLELQILSLVKRHFDTVK